MSKFKVWVAERPVLFSVVIIFLSIIFTEIPLLPVLEPYLGLKKAFYIMIVLEQGLAGLAIFWLLGRFGWLNQSGLTPLREWRALWLGWPLLLMALLNAVDFFSNGSSLDVSQPVVLVLHMLAALSTGWIEELMMRGLILTAYLKKWGKSRGGIYWAVMFSSILFGLLHMVNYFAGRKPLINCTAQIVFSLFFGVFFAACVLRNRSVWPMVLLHAAYDWTATLQEVSIGGELRLPGTVAPMTGLNALYSILFALPFFLYGLVILRKVKPGKLDEV